jgi:hypothetical protein
MRSTDRSAATANATACSASAFIPALYNEHSSSHDESSFWQRDLAIAQDDVSGRQHIEGLGDVGSAGGGAPCAQLPASANGQRRADDGFAGEHCHEPNQTS